MSDFFIPGMGMVAAAFVVGATFGGITLIFGMFVGPAYTLIGRPTQEKWVTSFLSVGAFSLLPNGYRAVEYFYQEAWRNSYRLSVSETGIAFCFVFLSFIAVITGVMWGYSGYRFGRNQAVNQPVQPVYLAMPQQQQSTPETISHEDRRGGHYGADEYELPEAIRNRMRGQNGSNN